MAAISLATWTGVRLLSGHMSSSTSTLTVRQAETVDRLVDAAVDEVRSVGFGGLTVRNVAARAGVAPATAYTYFGSKEHLVGEVFYRRLMTLPDVAVDRRLSSANRVAAALREVALLVADEPELSAACTIALLGDDPEVRSLRDRIGGTIHRRLLAALGDPARDGKRDGNRAALDAIELAFSGAMLQTGTGHLSYDELGDRLAAAAELILGGRR